MRLLCSVALTFLAASPTRPHLDQPDFPAAIRRLAVASTAGVSVTPAGTSFSVYLFHPPRGYETIVTLLDRPDGTSSVAVAIYENSDGFYSATVLVDQDDDGMLDFVAVTHAPTAAAVRQQLQNSAFERAAVTPEHQTLYNGVRATVERVPSN